MTSSLWLSLKLQPSMNQSKHGLFSSSVHNMYHASDAPVFSVSSSLPEDAGYSVLSPLNSSLEVGSTILLLESSHDICFCQRFVTCFLRARGGGVSKYLIECNKSRRLESCLLPPHIIDSVVCLLNLPLSLSPKKTKTTHYL